MVCVAYAYGLQYKGHEELRVFVATKETEYKH